MKKCSVSSCEQKHYGRGFCSKHYFPWKKYGDPLREVKRVDGHSSHPLYHVWINMVRRCTNPDTQDAALYKERGITVCDRWLGVSGFHHFLADMGEKPEGTTLDRIDNARGYSPENCRWATPHQQAANTRRNKSGVVGVNFVKARGTWDARIMVKRKVYLLGTFKTKEEAIQARKEAERRFNICL
jgi:hypothetical protein